MVNLYFVNRIGRINHRIRPHLAVIRTCSDKNSKSKALKKYASFNKHFKRIKVFIIIRTVVFVLLYASVISAVLADVFIIGDATNYIAKIGGVLGGSILLALLAILNHIIILETADAHVLASEIISASTLCEYIKSNKVSS